MIVEEDMVKAVMSKEDVGMTTAVTSTEAVAMTATAMCEAGVCIVLKVTVDGFMFHLRSSTNRLRLRASASFSPLSFFIEGIASRRQLSV
jgi:hypothetical protein